MRSLSMLMRVAEDMRRVAMVGSPFFEDPWRLYRLAAPWSQLDRPHWYGERTMATPKIDKNSYQVSMDVGSFKPSELTVKVVDNNVVIEGKYEEHEDDNQGFISRHFVRQFALPQGYEADKAISTLSSDGLLTVSVPKPASETQQQERLIPIQQTGPAHLNDKETSPAEDSTTDKGKTVSQTEKSDN